MWPAAEERESILLEDSIAGPDVIPRGIVHTGGRRDCTAFLLSRVCRAVVFRQRRGELDCTGAAS